MISRCKLAEKRIDASLIKETSRAIFLTAYKIFCRHIFCVNKELSPDDASHVFERIHNIALENYDAEIWVSVEADNEKIWDPAVPGKDRNFPLVPTLVTYVRAILIDRFPELICDSCSSDVSITEKFIFVFVFSYIQAMKESTTTHLPPELFNDALDSIVEHLIHFGNKACDFNCLCADLIIENLSLYNHLNQAVLLEGLYNRHALSLTWAGKKDDTTVGMIMLDGDDFKKVNDTCGHDTGDKVLKIYQDSILKAIELIDNIAGRTFPARWGGEEFAICVYNSNQDEIMALSKKIKCELSLSAEWDVLTKQYKDKVDKISFPRTVSQGIALGKKSEFKTIEKLVEKADEQLYLAKNNVNKNCIYYENSKIG